MNQPQCENRQPSKPYHNQTLHLSCTEFLLLHDGLKKEKNVFVFFFFPQTALLHAANHNHHLMVADLISLGANVNEANNSGKSCLHLSAEKGYIRVLEVRVLFSRLRFTVCL